MSTSPLSSRRIVGLAAVLALTVGMWQVGCASAPLAKRTAIASEQLSGAIDRLQVYEIQLYQQGQISAEDHAAWQQSFLKLGYSILALNEAVRAGKSETATDQIRTSLTVLQFLTTQSSKLRPTERLLLLSSIETVRSVLVALSTQVEK